MLMGVTEWAPFDEYKFKVTGVVNLPLFGDKVFCNSDTISKGYFVIDSSSLFLNSSVN